MPGGQGGSGNFSGALPHFRTTANMYDNGNPSGNSNTPPVARPINTSQSGLHGGPSSSNSPSTTIGQQVHGLLQVQSHGQSQGLGPSHVPILPGASNGQMLSTNRLMDLLDAVKIEFDSLVNEINIRKNHQEDIDFKIQAQVNEMVTMQKYIHDLERSHIRTRAAYEDELAKNGKSLKEAEAALPLLKPKDPFVLGLALYDPPNIGSGLLSRVSDTQKNNTSMMGIKESMKLPAMKSLNISQAAGQADFYSPVESRRPSIIVPHVTKHLGNNEEMVVFYGSEEAVAEFGIDLAYSLDHESVVCSVGFSKDGKFLATGSNRIVNVYEVSTGKLLLSLQDEASSPDLDLFIRSVAFSPDTLYLACGSEDKIIRIWDLQTKHIVHTFEGHQQDIYSIAYSADGSLLASGSGDCLVKLWDPLHGKFIKDLLVEDPEEQKDAGVTSVAFSPDGYFLVAGALDKAIRIWDVNTGDLLKTIPEAHSDSVYSVGFSPDGLSLISGGLDRSVNLWRFDPSDKFLVKGEELAGHKDFVLATSFLGDSGYAVSGSKDRQLLIWKTRSTASRNSSGEKPTLVCWFQAHKNSIITMAIPSSPQAMVFATGSGDKKAKIWRYHYLPKSPKNLTIDKRMKLEDSEV